MQDLVNQLATYYRARGSWEGVQASLGQGTEPWGGMMGGMMNAPNNGGMMGMMGGASGSSRVLVADARGIVVADSGDPLGRDNRQVGTALDAATLANGMPIQADGQTVGT